MRKLCGRLGHAGSRFSDGADGSGNPADTRGSSRAVIGPAEQRPVNMEKVLEGLYRRLPDNTQPNNLQTVMEQWLQRSQAARRRF